MLEQDDFAGVWAKITPMNKTSTVADIANAVLFFASPASRQITGAISCSRWRLDLREPIS